MNFSVTKIHGFTHCMQRKRNTGVHTAQHRRQKGHVSHAYVVRCLHQIKHHVVVARNKKDRPCDITCTHTHFFICDFLSFFEMPHMLVYISLWSFLPPSHTTRHTDQQRMRRRWWWRRRWCKILYGIFPLYSAEEFDLFLSESRFCC